MSILQSLGWQKARFDRRRRGPAWTSGYARAAAESQNVGDSWAALPAADSYKLAAERYMISDLVYMCVKKLADLGSGLQIALFDPRGERDPLTGIPLDSARLSRDQHPFYELWDRPNPFDSRQEFMEAIITTLLLSPKGVFVHLDDGRRAQSAGDRVKRVTLKGPPRALWWILPEPMSVVVDETRFIGGYNFSMSGERTHFEPNAIMRMTEFHPLNRYNSLSRIVPVNIASSADIESQKAGYSMFRNGFRPSAVVESDRDRVDPEELKLMERLWNEQQVGADNFHKLFPVWAGFRVREFGFSPRDSESVSIAGLNRERVFGVFGVHPGLILSNDVNLANAKVAEHATRAWTLAPLMARIAGEITSILPCWPAAPAAEAHFVNVVPADLQTDAETALTNAEAAVKRTEAIEGLVAMFGEDGLRIAQRWDLLPDDVSVSLSPVQPDPPPENGAVRFAEGVGWSR